MHRLLIWAEVLVLPLTVQHVGGHVVQLAAVHVLALTQCKVNVCFEFVPR
jgi:hypothetical protein